MLSPARRAAAPRRVPSKLDVRARLADIRFPRLWPLPARQRSGAPPHRQGVLPLARVSPTARRRSPIRVAFSGSELPCPPSSTRSARSLRRSVNSRTKKSLDFGVIRSNDPSPGSSKCSTVTGPPKQPRCSGWQFPAPDHRRARSGRRSARPSGDISPWGRAGREPRPTPPPPFRSPASP